MFCSDQALTRGLAAKTGLSGVAALAAPDDAHAARARSAAAKEGVLIDLKVAPVGDLDWPDESFDMAVIDNTGDSFSSLAAPVRDGLLQSIRRVLRAGGRIELIERLGGDSSAVRHSRQNRTPKAAVPKAHSGARVQACSHAR